MTLFESVGLAAAHPQPLPPSDHLRARVTKLCLLHESRSAESSWEMESREEELHQHNKERSRGPGCPAVHRRSAAELSTEGVRLSTEGVQLSTEGVRLSCSLSVLSDQSL